VISGRSNVKGPESKNKSANGGGGSNSYSQNGEAPNQLVTQRDEKEMQKKTISRMCTMCTLTIHRACFQRARIGASYKQPTFFRHSGIAQNRPWQPDAQLVNPWAYRESTSPWCFRTTTPAFSTLDDGQGVKLGLVVTSLLVNGVAGTPTESFHGSLWIYLPGQGHYGSSVSPS